MSRYIDADALKDDLIHNRGFYPAIVASAIKNTPTADVVEVEEYKDQLCQLNAKIYELQLQLETARATTVREFADRLKKYYTIINSSTNSNLVAYHVDQVAKEMLEGK
jgi:hypothetical protein